MTMGIVPIIVLKFSIIIIIIIIIIITLTNYLLRLSDVLLLLLQTAREFLPSMLEKNHGHIVNIASMSAKSGTAFLVDYR